MQPYHNVTDPKMKKEIINYCYSEIKNFNKEVLLKQGIPQNLFIELMYDLCLFNLDQFGEYELNESDYRKVWQYAKNMTLLIQSYIDGKVELLAIDNDGHYIFQKPRQLLE